MTRLRTVFLGLLCAFPAACGEINTNGTPSVYVERFVDGEMVDYASGTALLSLTRTVP